MKEGNLKRFDPFGTLLEQAIKDESNPLLGSTQAKKDLFSYMANMVATQADQPDRDFYETTGIRFGRLNREEHVAYLEGHRKTLLDGPEVLFFDTELHYINQDLDRGEKMVRAVGINIKPTPELLATWRECDHNAREFVQRIPYLKQLLAGLIAVLKLEFIEKELRCYKTPFSPEQIKRLQAIEFIDAQTGETRTYTMEEISMMGLITLTYEDWLSGRPGHYSAGDLFEVMQHTDGGLTTLRVHELTHSEFQKIQAKREEILEGYVSAYAAAFISDFERRYSKSKEKKVLVQNELELLQQLLFNPKSEAIYSVYTDTLWLSFRNDRRTDETVHHWYKRICVDGDDAMDAIAPMHVNIKVQNLSDSGSTKYVVAALAFSRFKSYLEQIFESNVKTTQEPIVNVPQLNDEARRYLNLLGGNNQEGEKIMSDQDFSRLCGYVESMIEQHALPEGIEPIGSVQWWNGHLRYTFYCIHNEQYGTQVIKDFFIGFIHAVFPQFTGNEAVTKKRFSAKPSSWNRYLKKIARKKTGDEEVTDR